MEIRLWRFQNYRDCRYTCNPHKFEIPALWFPCRVPVIPCKHLQCALIISSYNKISKISRTQKSDKIPGLRCTGPLNGLGSNLKKQNQPTKIPLLDQVFIYNSKTSGTLSQSSIQKLVTWSQYIRGGFSFLTTVKKTERNKNNWFWGLWKTGHHSCTVKRYIVNMFFLEFQW